MHDTNAFDTGALRLFDEVARSGSFTAAAELLGYTQSAVSRRVAALERAAGGPLFERLARGVRLTPRVRPCTGTPSPCSTGSNARARNWPPSTGGAGAS
ncbi:LysR family transcriptional regulator [Nonomuraea rubra]|uniref:helix-turn-helix domain-containing protein n=1 Tax=Nonomuraea rubra TaxID=46180 RepID=UPI00361C1851